MTAPFLTVPEAQFKRGDVLFTRADCLMSRLIRWGERSRNEAEPLASHAALVVQGGPFDMAEIVEAETHVERNSLIESHGDEIVYAYRPLIAPEILELIAQAAEKRVGQGYGYIEIAAQLADAKLFGGRVIVRNLCAGDPRPICSRLVAECFGTQGYWFGIATYAADPDTMKKYSDQNPKFCLPLGTWIKGERD